MQRMLEDRFVVVSGVVAEGPPKTSGSKQLISLGTLRCHTAAILLVLQMPSQVSARWLDK